jgi:glycolate oxidase iron-sulfur subunit
MTSFNRQDEAAAYIKSLDCVHCGLCLEHCPTYRQTGRESANPRGRLYLMRALFEGRAEATPDLVEDLDLCLVCRACESACPSGVRFGDVIAQTRSQIRKRGFIRRWMMKTLLSRGRLRLFARLMRFYQRSGLRAVRHVLPARLRRMESYLPAVPRAADRRPLPSVTPASEPALGVVAVLEGCVMSILFQDVNRDTVRLLAAAGYEVRVPPGQACCGALHEHDGDLEITRRQLEINRLAFQDPAIAAIVMNSSGCAAGLRGADHLIPGGEAMAFRVVDITRFLVDHGERLKYRATPGRVTYDAPCHLHHAQRETTAPLELLRRVPGIDLVPMDMAELCCGAAGIYNLDHPDMSQAILDEKLDALQRTGAQTLLTGNPGCILQWRNGVAARGWEIEVLHPATFLARAMEDSP